MIESIRNIDFLLSFIYLSFFTVLLFYISSSYTDKTIRRYFRIGGVLKLFASQMYCFLYVYYYGYGDTIRFFRFGQFYKMLLVEIEGLSFYDWFFMGNQEFTQLVIHKVDYAYGFAESSFFTNKLSAYMSFFTFDSFLVNTAIFSLLSYSGIWKMYLVFKKLYPQLYRELAFAILFFPSVVFWGSGLMKDTLSIGALGWMTWSFCHIFFIKEKISFKFLCLHVLIILACSWIIKSVKVYILISYLAGISLWIFHSFGDKIQNKIVRAFSIPFLILIGGVSILIGLSFFSEQLDTFALENVVDTAVNLSSYIASLDGGSSYDLGTIDPSLFGLIKKIPAAVNVTLFRPYVWETKNFIMLFAALESLMVIILSMYVFAKVFMKNFLKDFMADGYLLFCLVFTIIFGFAVGLTSQNFGTLMRYKIPIIPIYVSGIFIIYYNTFNKGLFEVLFSKKKK